MKLDPLPPLNSLVAFEASVRHLSFTRAANELHVTQGAVSRQVRLLEDYLGQMLFIRTRNQLSVTPAGMEYYTKVQEALKILVACTQNFVEQKEKQQLTLVTSHALAFCWLLPRYRDFQDQYPEIDVRIVAMESLKDARQFEFDIAVFHCPTIPKQYRTAALFREKVFPVCSPDYLAQHHEVKDPSTLHKATLLSMETTTNWVHWDDWLKSCNLQRPTDNTHRVYLNNYPLLIQAALNGQGVALAWEKLVDSYLESGLLVKPIDNTLETNSYFYLLEPKPIQPPKPGLAPFINWLKHLK